MLNAPLSPLSTTGFSTRNYAKNLLLFQTIKNVAEAVNSFCILMYYVAGVHDKGPGEWSMENGGEMRCQTLTEAGDMQICWQIFISNLAESK